MTNAELPGPWETMFIDYSDPETGEHRGEIVNSRVIARVPCIGCTLRRTDPDKAVIETSEVWVNGERVEDESGCWCDQQAVAGFTPWRSCPFGSLLATPENTCPRCKGGGVRYSKRMPWHEAARSGARWQCFACKGTGWRDGRTPWEEEGPDPP